MLASGGNDNKVFIWSLHSDKPLRYYIDTMIILRKFTHHIAAIKAMAWSPH
jgi:cell division cycle 20-like protein 1 (cofactor of APC complex)